MLALPDKDVDTSPILRTASHLGLIFCGSCLDVLPLYRAVVVGHVYSCYHPQLSPGDCDRAVSEAAGEVAISDSSDGLQNINTWATLKDALCLPPAEPLPFLPTQPVWRCGHCGRSTRDKKQMGKHMRSEHQALPATKMSEHPGQRLSCGNTFRYIAVSQYREPAEVWDDDSSKPTATTAPTIPAFSFAALQNDLDYTPDSEPGGQLSCTITDPARADANHFIDELGFGRHLAGQDANVILASLDISRSALRPQIDGFMHRLRAMVTKVQCRMDDEGEIVLLQLRKRHDDAEVGGLGPFRHRIDDKTLMTNYMGHVARVLVYAAAMYTWDSPGDPPCSLTEAQANALSAVAHHPWGEDDDPAASEGVVHDLFAALLGQDLRASAFESVVLSAMAAEALEPRLRGWRSPRSFGSRFSGLIKVALMVVYSMTLRDQAAAADVPGGGDKLAALRRNMHRFVFYPRDEQAGGQLPLMRCFTMEQVVATYIRHEVVQPNIDWVGPSRALCVAFGVEATCETVGQMMAANLTQLEDDLSSLLFGASLDDPAIAGAIPKHLASIRDDRTNATVGYSFLKDYRNAKWVQPAAELIGNTIDRSTALSAVWRVENSATRPVNADTWRGYRQVANDALRRLATALYWGAGQPTRAPELTSLRWKNTAGGGLRNVFVVPRGVATRTVYSKNGWRTAAKTRPIWRLMSYRLSWATVFWIAVVDPFLSSIEAALLGPAGARVPAPNGFLLSTQRLGPPRPLATGMVTRELCSLSSRYLGAPVNLQKMRHLLIGFGRRFLETRALQEGVTSLASGVYRDDDDNGDDTEAETLSDMVERQAGHSAFAGRNFYAIEFDQGTEFDKSMLLCAAFHSLFRATSGKRRRTACDGGGEEDDEDVGDDERDREGGAGPSRDAPGCDGTTAPGVQDDGTPDKAARAVAPGLLDPALLDPALVATVVPTGRSNGLRPHQREVLGYILDPSVDDIVYVAPTGSGKSLAFMLPAQAHHEGKYIVVEPTRALVHDIARRLADAHIPNYVWEPVMGDRGDAPMVARVIVLTPESLGTTAFTHYINRVEARGGISMAVLDEAHEVINRPANDARPWVPGGAREYRPVYRNIGALLRTVSHRRLYMTGTLPVAREGELFVSLGLDTASCRLVRERCAMPSHAYGFVEAAPGPAFARVAAETLLALAPGDRALLFFLTRGECACAARRLDLPYCHSAVADQDAVLRRWRADGGALCTTSGMITGVDIARVSLVLFCGAYTLLDMVQGFGRARGIASVVLVAQYANLSTPDLQGFAAAACRRRFLDAFLNGGGGASCTTADNPCDRCRARPAPLPCVPARPATAAPLQDLPPSPPSTGPGLPSPSSHTASSPGIPATPVATTPAGDSHPRAPPLLPVAAASGSRTGPTAEAARLQPGPPRKRPRQEALDTNRWVAERVHAVVQLLEAAFRGGGGTASRPCICCVLDGNGAPAANCHPSTRCPGRAGEMADRKEGLHEEIVPHRGGTGLHYICGWCWLPQYLCDTWEEQPGRRFRKRDVRCCSYGLGWKDVMGYTLAFQRDALASAMDRIGGKAQGTRLLAECHGRHLQFGSVDEPESAGRWLRSKYVLPDGHEATFSFAAICCALVESGCVNLSAPVVGT